MSGRKAAAGRLSLWQTHHCPTAIMSDTCLKHPASLFELRFESLFNPGRALAFPCDARGRVEMDGLTDHARRNYLYARAVVGREFSRPAVVNGALR